jgi:isopenicillin N synthase-like dioxygenase
VQSNFDVLAGDDALRFERDGYLVLTPSTTVQTAVAAVFAEGLRFFRQSEETKLLHGHAAPYEGYKDIGYSYSTDPQRPDLAQSYCVKPTDSSGVRAAKHADDGLRECMLGCASLFDDIATSLACSLARYFDKEQTNGMIPFRCRRGSHLQLNFYSPHTSTRELLQDAHEDGTFVTLTTATASGLEIQTKDGTFVAADIAPGEVLCMPGEIMSLMTGGRICPLYHRVRRLGTPVERLSLMYFASPDPNPGCVMEPWVRNTTNATVDIMARVVSNPTRYGLAPLP